MAALVILGVVALVGGGALTVQALKVRRSTQRLLEAADEAGLRGANATGVFLPAVFAMTPDGMGVTVSSPTAGAEIQYRLQLEAPGRLPDGLELRRTLAAGSARGHQEGLVVATGDPGFDDQVLAVGTEVHLAAALDAATRREVLEVLEGGALIHWGQVAMTVRAEAADGGSLAGALRRLVELARRLQPPADPAPRLAESALHDPSSGVRRRALELLLERFPKHEVVRPTLRAAAADRHPAVRLLAATRLGDQGRPVLVELAMARGTPEPVAAAAARAAGAALGSDRAQQLLDRGLAERQPRLALAAVQALGACGGEAACARLAEVRHAPDPDLAAAAVTALAAAQGAAAEDMLVEALADEWRELRLAAAEALGRVGTVRAVTALREAAGGSAGAGTWGRDGELRRAVAAAVAGIQARAVGADHGQVSLAEAGGGEVAIAGDEGGRVGVVGDE